MRYSTKGRIKIVKVYFAAKSIDKDFLRDEASFHFSVYVNKYNLQFWAQNQPHAHLLQPLTVEKMAVPCGLGCNGVIGPCVKEEADGYLVAVNTERYDEFMKKNYSRTKTRTRKKLEYCNVSAG